MPKILTQQQDKVWRDFAGITILSMLTACAYVSQPIAGFITTIFWVSLLVTVIKTISLIHYCVTRKITLKIIFNNWSDALRVYRYFAVLVLTGVSVVAFVVEILKR